jgi:hypothetical protein
VRVPASIAYLSGVLLSGAFLFGQQIQDFTVPTPLPPNDVLVIGFMGGRDAWNDERVGVGRMAKRLREMNLKGLHLATVENINRNVARELVRKAFDRNQNGSVDANERSEVRLIVYGQSFGGAATVKFARELRAVGIPVMLTVQVDSVGRDDAVIPSNVAAAANLFQRDGFFVHGPAAIRAEDPATTKIIGNFQFSYRAQSIDVSNVPWYKKFMRKPHTEMDNDPKVWERVEELILEALKGNALLQHERGLEQVSSQSVPFQH